jgi:hypothetical protein
VENRLRILVLFTTRKNIDSIESAEERRNGRKMGKTAF